jgi:CRP-like cAMP-binding protein
LAEENVKVEADWSAILTASTRKKYQKGDVLCREDEMNTKNNMWIIEFGQCRFEKMLHGAPSEVGKIGVNETVGEISFLLGGKYDHTFVVESNEVRYRNM